MSDRFEQPKEGSTGWNVPLNQNFADLGIEVADAVDTWGDLPQPTGEISSNGNPKVYRVSADNLFVVDTGSSWNIIAGLGSAANPLPSISTERVETEKVQNSKDHATTKVSHTRYVGPDDPAELTDFKVEEGDVWIKID